MIRRVLYWVWPLIGMALAIGILYVIPAGYLIPQPTPEEIAEDVVVRVNAEREALGLEPLEVDGPLTQMALWRSEDMVAGGYVGHDPPEGHPTLLDLGAPFDYYCIPDENIARTDRPVRITDANTVVDAVGLELNNETRILKLFSKVKGIYHDSGRSNSAKPR